MYLYMVKIQGTFSLKKTTLKDLKCYFLWLFNYAIAIKPFKKIKDGC